MTQLLVFLLELISMTNLLDIAGFAKPNLGFDSVANAVYIQIATENAKS